MFFNKKVSCISLAGCSKGKLSALKTCQSSSISGPSEIVKPSLLKIETISFLTKLIGCLEPSLYASPGKDKSLPEE